MLVRYRVTSAILHPLNQNLQMANHLILSIHQGIMFLQNLFAHIVIILMSSTERGLSFGRCLFRLLNFVLDHIAL